MVVVLLLLLLDLAVEHGDELLDRHLPGQGHGGVLPLVGGVDGGGGDVEAVEELPGVLEHQLAAVAVAVAVAVADAVVVGVAAAAAASFPDLGLGRPRECGGPVASAAAAAAAAALSPHVLRHWRAIDDALGRRSWQYHE